MKYCRIAKISPLEIVDENGNTVCTVEVQGDYLRMRNGLMASLGKIKKQSDEKANSSEIGESAIAVIKSVYGEENVRKLLDAFSGNYYEMILCVSEHINSEVKPALDKLAQKTVSSIKKMV